MAGPHWEAAGRALGWGSLTEEGYSSATRDRLPREDGPYREVEKGRLAQDTRIQEGEPSR